MIRSTLDALARAVAALAAASVLAACAPLVMGGVVVGGLVATDRRTTGTQVEDQSIELKASSRVSELATLGHVSVVSYNRT
ncbi:MAG TPA: transporter, partial [Rubrivivax sp.]|nr:transporter [Rubrivivax sp.]